MLSVWQMICQAVALANALATGAFLEQVAHELQVAKNGMSWQQAHELFLVYLEAVRDGARRFIAYACKRICVWRA